MVRTIKALNKLLNLTTGIIPILLRRPTPKPSTAPAKIIFVNNDANINFPPSNIINMPVALIPQAL